MMNDDGPGTDRDAQPDELGPEPMTDEEFERRYDLRNIGPGMYEGLRDSFEWDIPETVNMAEVVFDQWADDEGRVALYWESDDGRAENYTFAELSRLTTQCANAFRQRGVQRGDIVAVFLPNTPAHVVATFAAHRLGAVCMPLYHLFGPDGLSYRLGDAEPDVIVTDETGIGTLADVDGVPQTVFLTETPVEGEPPTDSERFWPAVEEADPAIETVATRPADPAQLFYTSGTTGDPKGVVQPHRYVVAHRHIGQYMRDFTPDDLLWHAGNLAWAGGFVTAIEAWSIGMPMLKYEGRFDAETALELLDSYDVDMFVTAPTALRGLMDLPDETIEDYEIDLRLVFTGGERVTVDVLQWADETFDAVASTGWGQTECYGMGWQPLGADYPEKQGTIGKPLPGFEATVLDEAGDEVERGEIGEMAIARADNPSMFLEYYRDPEATEAATEGKWLRTGDSVVVDEDGYYWFQGRLDDIIISSGYRLSPTEIEGSLNEHPAVQESAVIGVPDEKRTNIAKAFVMLNSGYEPTDHLEEQLQRHVKDTLAKFQYPREIAFREALPTTITGKIQRKELREQERAE